MEVIATIKPASDTTEQQIFYRLTALWAISEAFLGGMLHALKLPGTGLFVGGAAVICISLIAWHCPKRSAILKATILVVLVKGMLSPHSPVGAYLAVAIQGGLGYLLFWSKDYFRLSCFALGILTQLQSALQRLVVLVIVFGSDIYGIANGFVNYILKKAGFAEGEYVYYIIIMYIGLHLLMGIAVGWFTGKLPAMLEKVKPEHLPEQLSLSISNAHTVFKKKRRSSQKLYAIVIIVSITLILAGLQSVISPGKALIIILRAITIVTAWHFVIAPALLLLFNKWTTKRSKWFADELKVILQLIPDIKQDILYSWSYSTGSNYYIRLKRLLIKLLPK